MRRPSRATARETEAICRDVPARGEFTSLNNRAEMAGSASTTAVMASTVALSSSVSLRIARATPVGEGSLPVALIRS